MSDKQTIELFAGKPVEIYVLSWVEKNRKQERIKKRLASTDFKYLHEEWYKKLCSDDAARGIIMIADYSPDAIINYTISTIEELENFINNLP